MSEPPLPVLHIDWGIDLKQGYTVSPKLTIQNLASDQPPLVYFPKTQGICRDDWHSMPTLRRGADGNWCFYQELEPKNPGQFLMRLIVIDASPGLFDPVYYHCDFRIIINDPKEIGNGRTIEFEAEGHVVGDLPELQAGDRLIIKSKKNIDVSEPINELLRPKSSSTNSSKAVTEDRSMTIPFVRETHSLSGLPYVSERADSMLTSRLTLTEPGGRSFRLFGGKHLTFGRDVPEENWFNDIPLNVEPRTEEEIANADGFAVLNRLFSREHALLTLDEDGAFLRDVRQSGIQDATILDDTSLEKGSTSLLFSNDVVSATDHLVLFSKMLLMRVSAYYGQFWHNGISRTVPENLPYPLLNQLYGMNSNTGLSAVSIKHEKYLKQKPHAETLKRILGKTPLAASPWWQSWFGSEQNVDPRYGQVEYWLVPKFVTMGRTPKDAIRLKNRAWDHVRLRILYVNEALYIENLSQDAEIEYRSLNQTCPLRAFRPLPLRAGTSLHKNQAALIFDEGL